MSDFESSEAPSLLPELQADVSTTDDDREMMAIWNKNNGPVAELENPPMPKGFAAARRLQSRLGMEPATAVGTAVSICGGSQERRRCKASAGAWNEG